MERLFDRDSFYKNLWKLMLEMAAYRCLSRAVHGRICQTALCRHSIPALQMAEQPDAGREGEGEPC